MKNKSFKITLLKFALLIILTHFTVGILIVQGMEVEKSHICDQTISIHLLFTMVSLIIEALMQLKVYQLIKTGYRDIYSIIPYLR